MITNKQAVLINYSIMTSELYYSLQEHTRTIKIIFEKEPSLGRDVDLLEVSEKFSNLCYALKNLDELINKLGERENEKKS